MIAKPGNCSTQKLAFFLVLAEITLPAFAAKRITVEQLEHSIAAFHGKPEADQAWQLSDFELAERLTPASLARLEAALPGDKARQSLLVLADQSQFLDPPAAEIPATAAPDLPAQRRIMSLVVSYVKNAIPQLPNFFATRVTTRFEDTPQLLQLGGAIPYQPLHRVDTSSATVLYRDGREVVDTGEVKARTSQPMAQGLNSWGIFGPILGTVLVDAAQNSLAWSHWEKGADGVQAVFKFQVPKDKSHYEVNFCCVASQRATVVAGLSPFRRIVGYRGQMAVDPSTGTITRLAVEADLNSTDPVVKAAILVEYGPVEIGGRTYFCPIKSIATALAQTLQVDPIYKYPLANQMQPLKASLSDVSFTQYHVFRAEARVVPENQAHADQPPPPSNSVNTNTPDLKDSTPTPPDLAASQAPENKTPPPPIANSASNSEASIAAPLRAPSPEPPVPEITATATDRLPDLPARPSQTEPKNGFTLQTTSRLVDVGLVAYDKKGRPVTDLKPDDFALYDNGAKQQIRFFSQAAQAPQHANAPATNASLATTEPNFTNRPATTESANFRTPKSETNVTILMIDAGNLAFSDLTYAREEMLRFLKALPPDEPVGLYVMKSYGFQILQEPTTDHAQLAATLTKWMPSAQDLARAQDEEQRNREQFDFVHSIYDLVHLNGNESTDPESSGQGSVAALAHPTDARLRALGSNPERDAFEVLQGVARHLSGLRGHKSLVWVASDNVLADWADHAATKEDQGSKFIQNVALQAQEALNEAHVSIYPLDASQLEVGGVGANIGTRNILAVGMPDRGKDDPNLPQPGGQGGGQAAPVIGDSTPGMKPGRATAQMHQDTHPIQPAFRQLAEATGGRAMRRAGDIAAELNAVVEDGRAAYLLSFTPNSAPDDKYHVITIKLVGKRDVALRYRNGYEYDKEPATLKERIRQAIWQPTDVAQIAISAIPQADSNGSLLRLNIAATDLALAQQADRWTDKLDIFLIARDDAALHAKIAGQTVGLRLHSATYQKILRDGLTFDERIETTVLAGSLRVIVVDQNSGRMGSITVPATAIKSKP